MVKEEEAKTKTLDKNFLRGCFKRPRLGVNVMGIPLNLP